MELLSLLRDMNTNRSNVGIQEIYQIKFKVDQTQYIKNLWYSKLILSYYNIEIKGNEKGTMIFASEVNMKTQYNITY